jgi:integrase
MVGGTDRAIPPVLTTLQIKSAKPADRAFKLADAGGLFLLVQPNGSKLWRYKFRLDGVEGLQALGAFPEVSLADARAAHAESRKLVAKGIHPVQARREQRESRAQAELHRVKGSFGAVCADWNKATSADLRSATVLQRNREIEKDLTPRFKERPISKITRLELTAALKEVEARAPEVARNLRNYLWGIFEYAIDSGLIEDNPVPPVRVLRKRAQENHPALSPELLAEFLRKLDALDTIHTQTRIAMLLVVLTACRKSEVIGGKWSEIDLDAAEWEIPAERMKAGRTHWIPLSRQAMKLIRDLRAIAEEGSVYMFPNRRDTDRPMADRSLNALMERLGFSGDGTPHGMRATFSTHFNASGANIDVIEHCLAHVPANRVRAAYNRHAYQVERREMLQAWADRVDDLRKTAVSRARLAQKERMAQQSTARAKRAGASQEKTAHDISQPAGS